MTRFGLSCIHPGVMPKEGIWAALLTSAEVPVLERAFEKDEEIADDILPLLRQLSPAQRRSLIRYLDRYMDAGYPPARSVHLACEDIARAPDC